MRRVKLMTAAAVVALMTMVGGAAAQDTNVQERTFLTFSSAFELPNLTLQPGTYVFKLADTPTRNVVQVWTRDEKQMLGHWTFVQASRTRVSDENVVMFKEMPAGTTPAVQYWYYPGESIGKEFIYPKDQAARIAKATNIKVLTAETETAAVSSIDAAGQVTEWKREEATVAAEPVAPAEAPAQVAQAEPPAEAPAREPSPVGTSGAQAESQVARADTLPQTSSPLALTGLLGLLALGGAAGVRALRK
jgi:hypothetical protein